MSHLHLAAPLPPILQRFWKLLSWKNRNFSSNWILDFCVCTNIQKIKERIIFQKFLRIKKILYKKFVHYITPSRGKNLQLFCQQRKIKIIYIYCLFILLLCIIWDLSNYFSMKLEILVLYNWKFFFTNHYINGKFYNSNRIKQDYQDIII